MVSKECPLVEITAGGLPWSWHDSFFNAPHNKWHYETKTFASPKANAFSGLEWAWPTVQGSLRRE
jgi:predicted alpha-1,6-mannanase (GH76 family)